MESAIEQQSPEFLLTPDLCLSSCAMLLLGSLVMGSLNLRQIICCSKFCQLMHKHHEVYDLGKLTI